MSQTRYATRQSIASTNMKPNMPTEVSNFVRSHTNTENANQPTPSENDLNQNCNFPAAMTNLDEMSATLFNCEPSVKIENMDVEKDPEAVIRSTTNEHIRKLKEARKRGSIMKVDKKLKKKRLNARLEKVLKPKNAFLIFNELNLKPEYEIVENMRGPGLSKTYTAYLTLESRTYSGEGLNVAGAKMVAADVALKDWFTRYFRKSEPSSTVVAAADDQVKSDTDGITNVEAAKTAEREPAPWSAVGSYAMHLLFTRWQMDVSSITSPAVDESTPSTVATASNFGNGSTSGSIPNIPGVPKAAKTVNELKNYPVLTPPKFPPKMQNFQPLYVFNLVFPNVPFKEITNETNVDERFQLQCKINNVLYEARARNKKDARRMIAVKVLKDFGMEFPSFPTAPAIKPNSILVPNPMLSANEMPKIN